MTFFKSSAIGRSELAKVQEDLYGNKLGILTQDSGMQDSCSPRTHDGIMVDEGQGKHYG